MPGQASCIKTAGKDTGILWKVGHAAKWVASLADHWQNVVLRITLEASRLYSVQQKNSFPFEQQHEVQCHYYR